MYWRIITYLHVTYRHIKEGPKIHCPNCMDKFYTRNQQSKHWLKNHKR